MRIVVLDGATLNPGDLPWQELEALGEVTVYERTPADEVTKRIGGAEAVFTNKTLLSREIIDGAGNLRFIGVLATGYNVVDVAAAKERGIPVCNVPDYSTAAVAQFTMALLLELCHHVGAHSESVHAGEWTGSHDFCYWKYPLVELAGKTLGIIGLGRIGRATARIGLSLGMKVIAFGRRQSEEGARLAEYVSLEELFARSDVISLHCPLFPETQGIIRKETLALMKDGVMLINTARGPLVVEQDLFDALESGKVAGAAVDVVSTEPIPGDSPLLRAKNCLITPHIAWASKESRQRLMTAAAQNLACFLLGETQNNVWGEG